MSDSVVIIAGNSTISIDMPDTPEGMRQKAWEMEAFANSPGAPDPALALTVAAFMRQIASLIDRVSALEAK